ncbi:hypothetical protein CBER1_03533 [Cercospora berteroae]|uniref:Uncharacterized protein n=1 Tax=Cercospora berteroae TaxID=357750 RepID=A0A2S6CFW0_9PEZI|nr:hypothetical protein CBER1_03533 [Cercospora berteroae]
MPSQEHAAKMEKEYESRPDPQDLTYNKENPQNNAPTQVDYEPHPEKSVPLSPTRQKIVNAITSLYSGSCKESGTGEEDLKVYAPEAVYDDPWSYCDTRYKIAGQWYGIPKIFHSKTLATEVVESTDASDKDQAKPGEDGRIVFKLRQEYTVKAIKLSKPVNSLVSLTLQKIDGEEKVRYHKDQWNEKEYSHEGIGRYMKELNGDHLTKITRPPGWMKEGAESEGVPSS